MIDTAMAYEERSKVRVESLVQARRWFIKYLVMNWDADVHCTTDDEYEVREGWLEEGKSEGEMECLEMGDYSHYKLMSGSGVVEYVPAQFQEAWCKGLPKGDVGFSHVATGNTWLRTFLHENGNDYMVIGTVMQLLKESHGGA